jgi:hypothetical protein
MSFWEKIEKDIRKNIQDSFTLFRKRSTAVSQKIEKLTEGGKKKYKVFTLKMKVQDEFTKLGGKVYDLSHKTTNPVKNKGVSSIISKIKKLESQITGMEKKSKTRAKKTKKKTKRKTVKKSRSTR